MKYFVILILIGLVAITSVNGVYGWWVPETPDELFKQSETVFVGNITSVNILEFERSNTYNVEENGVSRIIIENYTQTLDEYTVDIEEFLKNPQESNTITMLEATVGGVPGRSVSIGGFELGDRVLFYVPKIDGTNQYSPESFKIPKQCDAKSALEQPRIEGGNSFSMIQEGIVKENNFTANKSIQFVYHMDMRSLDEKNFDFQITIRKETDAGKFGEVVLSETIPVKSKICEWIATAKAEFIPQVGNYQMGIHATEGTGSTTFGGNFSVEENSVSYDEIISPLKQFKSGIPIDEIQCKDGLILLQKHDRSPACVTESTKQKLIERGWTENPVKINTTIKPIPYDPMLAKKITESNNQFTLDFYKQTSKEKNENIFFSSPSISTAFSILYEGAKGNTATEIQDVFGFPTDDHERQIGFMTFINTLNQKNNDENTVQMSNALWLANGFSPLPKYTNTAQTYYGSLIDTVNFATDAGRLEINDWVKSKTQNRIDELLVPGSITSLTKMVITNTIYFKGEWSYPFDPENTYDGDFAVDSTRTVTVPMMTYEHKMNFNHTSTEQMQILQMPYKGNSFSMLVILPHDAEDMQLVEDSITLDNLDHWKSQFRDFRGTIHIPKFTLDAEYDLKEILSDMGISSVFSSADLSGITGYKGLFVSKAVHKAFVEVNEVGTEAAAATAININESGGRLFKADHPFIFLIQDNTTNDILFIGKVMDPTK